MYIQIVSFFNNLTLVVETWEVLNTVCWLVTFHHCSLKTGAVKRNIVGWNERGRRGRRERKERERKYEVKTLQVLGDCYQTVVC